MVEVEERITVMKGGGGGGSGVLRVAAVRFTVADSGHRGVECGVGPVFDCKYNVPRKKFMCRF